MTVAQERMAIPEAPVYRVALVRERTLPLTRQQIRNPSDLAEVVADYLADADREHLVAVLVDSKARVIGVETVSIGTLDGAPAHPREVFKSAILANAAEVCLAHNHPSGDPTPSPEDRAVTRRMDQAGKVLGIPLRDHIVIGSGTGRFVSLRAEGMMVVGQFASAGLSGQNAWQRTHMRPSRVHRGGVPVRV